MALAVVWLVIASTAGAASLGRLAVLSAIGEPLRAEIELSVSAEDLESLSPRLAAVDDYAAAGLTYNPALNGARLVVQYRGDGRRVIDLVTTRAVNEPAIALIVELQMRGGRTARAYNVLLGPVPAAPVRAAPPPAPPVAVAAAAATPAPVVKPVQAAVAAPARPPRVTKAKAPAAVAAPADQGAYDRELKRLESQLNAGDRILKDMMSRVTVMEGQVAQLQKAFAALPTPAAGQETGKPVAEKPAEQKPVDGKSVTPPETATPVVQSKPAMADPTQPAAASAVPAAPPAAPVMQEVKEQAITRIDAVPYTPRKTDRMLNEALLVLAGGALALFIGLGYVMLSRRRAAKIAEAEAVIAAEAQNAG